MSDNAVTTVSAETSCALASRRARTWARLGTFLGGFALAALAAGAGCARRSTIVDSPREWTPAPLVIVSASREELPGGKASVKLVVRGDPTREAVEDLLRDYIEEHRRGDEEMWVSLFLEGMDVQSIEYAFAIARPGASPRIMVRESPQTYR